jgi:hypothetical protein
MVGCSNVGRELANAGPGKWLTPSQCATVGVYRSCTGRGGGLGRAYVDGIREALETDADVI